MAWDKFAKVRYGDRIFKNARDCAILSMPPDDNYRVMEVEEVETGKRRFVFLDSFTNFFSFDDRTEAHAVALTTYINHALTQYEPYYRNPFSLGKFSAFKPPKD